VPGSDVTAEHQTSVATRRTMEEIAGAEGKVWHSNRTELPAEESPAKTTGAGSAYQRLMARRTR
jgi:hypothetical protein